MGFDASVISGVVKFIEPEFNLTKLELGWAVSSLTLTSTLAMLIAGPISDKYGRKPVLHVAALLYAGSAILSALAPSFVFLVIARMIGGFGVGASLIIAPMYIAEIAPSKIRGTVVSFNQLNIVIGISVAFFSNYLILKLGQQDISWVKFLKIGEYNWRWMLGLEALPAILYFSALFSVPKSPRWLILKGREDEALDIMQMANGESQAVLEIEAVKQSFKQNNNKKKTKLKDVFEPALKVVLTIGIVLAVLQQITGINSIFFYAPMIFEQSGLGVDASFSQAIYVGLTNLVFTIVAMLLIDRVGRKPLLLVGVTGIAISMLVIAWGFNQATYTITNENIQSISNEQVTEKIKPLTGEVFTKDTEFKSAVENALGSELYKEYSADILTKAIKLNPQLFLFGILFFVASFAVSIGPVMWVMFSELFPNWIRAMAVSFVGFINSVVSFLVQLVFPWEITNLGTAPTFFIYGAFAALGLLFIIFWVPETKGKTLEELQLQLVKNK